MSDSPATPAAPSAEASWLRDHWDPDLLGQFEGKWVAVLGPEIIDSDTALQLLLARTASKVPLYALVSFKPRQ